MKLKVEDPNKLIEGVAILWANDESCCLYVNLTGAGKRAEIWFCSEKGKITGYLGDDNDCMIEITKLPFESVMEFSQTGRHEIFITIINRDKVLKCLESVSQNGYDYEIPKR